jgi:leucyl aminopeptidase (aminopeptidase T)
MDIDKTSTEIKQPQLSDFPDFDLTRLLNTVFETEKGEKVAILIDLKDPKDIQDFRFLKDPAYTIQRHAVEDFYKPLNASILESMGLAGGEIFAYEITGGSNLDLPDEAYSPDGKQWSLEKDIYTTYDIILCISTYSATAPLTAFAKQIGFRGATLHGVNDIILGSGLAVDYNQVSIQAEKLRLGVTKAEWVEIDFVIRGNKHTLKLLLGCQEAQKSHGLCRGKKPDIANLPAGEVYFVPEGAEGEFPMVYEGGTLGLMKVSGGLIREAVLIEGDPEVIAAHNLKLKSDPVTGELGELGFGTQVLPVSGRDIQDEKVLGTLHVATGRSDHLGGSLTPDRFASKMNATHDDILFAPHKTPDVQVTEARMFRDGKITTLIENYQPSAYLLGLLK